MDWSPYNNLLREWKSEITKRQRVHLKYARRFERLHILTGGPVTVLSALITGSIFTTFGTNEPVFRWIQLATGVASAIATIIVACIMFFKFSSRARKHKSSFDLLGSLQRRIHRIIETPVEHRDPPRDVLNSLQDEYDTVLNGCPTLPAKYSIDIDIPEEPKSLSDKLLSKMVAFSRMVSPSVSRSPTPPRVMKQPVQPSLAEGVAPEVLKNRLADLRDEDPELGLPDGFE